MLTRNKKIKRHWREKETNNNDRENSCNSHALKLQHKEDAWNEVGFDSEVRSKRTDRPDGFRLCFPGDVKKI